MDGSLFTEKEYADIARNALATKDADQGGDLRIAIMLRKFRRDFHVTRPAMYEACGLSKGTWSMIENGRRGLTNYTTLKVLLGLRQLVRVIGDKSTMNAYNEWAWDFIAVMYSVAGEKRERRRERYRERMGEIE